MEEQPIEKIKKTIRDVMAYAEVTRQPLCIISLDFKEAFDSISHVYIFAIHKRDQFAGQIQSMYSEMRTHQCQFQYALQFGRVVR
jgi:hypothetical protein